MNLNILTPFQWKNLRKSKLLTEKSADQNYSYGCIMGYFNLVEYNKLNNRIGSIEESDIYNNEANEYGREIEPHVTILYGLHDDELDEDEVIQFLKCIKLPIVKLSQISSFDNEEYDVLKWDVESEDLNLYNKIVTLMFPYTNKFPDYHAHCTIAYLVPGTAKKYSKDVTETIELPIEKWVYSMANGKKVSINSKGEVEEMRKATEAQESQEAKDESYNYKGYYINITPNKNFENRYFCQVLKDGKYKMGIRGPVKLESAKRDAELWVNGILAKNEQTST